MVYIYFNAFWDRFFDITHAVNYTFFIDLFSKVFQEQVEIGTITNSEILCESMFGQQLLNYKQWKYTFFFSGEPSCKNGNYSAILNQERSYNNIIHLPLFIPYIYSKNFNLDNIKSTNNSLQKKNIICTVISNPNGIERNKTIDIFEKYFHIDHLGPYKKNTNIHIAGDCGSDELINEISKYKFIICFENSERDAYITEKIINPLVANIIPIYWGCKRVESYFNKKRFLLLDNFSDEGIFKLLKTVETIKNDTNIYEEIIQTPIFNNNITLSIETIANDIKRLLFQSNKLLIKIILPKSILDSPNIKEKLSTYNIPYYMTNYNLNPNYSNDLDYFYYNLFNIHNYYKNGYVLIINNLDNFDSIVSLYNNLIDSKKNINFGKLVFNNFDNIKIEELLNIYTTENLIISYDSIKTIIQYCNNLNSEFIETYANLYD